MTMVDKVLNGASEGFQYGFSNAAIGFLCGYTYADLADLPKLTVAKYWAISNFACQFFMEFASSFTDNKKAIGLLRAVSFITTDSIFIVAMRNQNLLGDKMTLFLIPLCAYRVQYNLQQYFDKPEKSLAIT